MRLKQPLLLLAGLIISIGLSAQTVYVNSSTGNDGTGDGSSGNPYKTFHKGYTEVSSGGTLDLTGTFTWTDADETGDAVNSGYTINKSITIQGQGASSTIIQADATESTADRRVLTFPSGNEITIKDVTIQHGVWNGGGNSSYGGGGGIQSEAQVTIQRCIFTKNEAILSSGNAGGLSIKGGTFPVIIDDCIFSYNTGYYTGGLNLYNTNHASTEVKNSTFHHNESTSGSYYCGSGMQIALGGLQPHIYNCTFTNNIGGTTLTLDRQGAYLTNLTISNNNANGLWTYACHFYTKNNIITGNSGSYYDLKFSSSSNLHDNGNNLLGTTTGTLSSGTWDASTTLGVAIGDINLSTTLSENSSFNISTTLAISSGSIAINAGGSGTNGSMNVPCTDQRGYFSNGNKDIGAYEYNGLTYGPDITVSTNTITDLSYYTSFGPSPAKTFTVSGTDLSEDILITPQSPVYFEISTDGVSFSTGAITLTPSGGTVNNTIIYVRLRSGYGASTYNSSVLISTACDEETISLSGTVTTTPASTYIWDGSTDSDWNTTSNWSSGSVPTGSWHVIIPSSAPNFPEIDNILSSPAICNDLTINENAELTILDLAGLSVSGDITNNGTININSSASGEGSLLVDGSLSGSGTYNVQRYLSGSQWHLVTSPITAGTAGVFEDIWLRPYDESTNAFGEYITPTTTPMPTGQGFSVWADANETRTFTGTINHGSTGALSLQLTGTAGANTGWNLMGNPYPSAIDWDAASGWSRTNIADAVYVWNSSQYATYVGGIPANGGSRYVAPGQGFFIQATAAGASVTMDNGIRLHNGVSFLKNTQSDPDNTIRIQVSADGYQDENVIAIRDANANAFDPQVDAYKLPGSADAPQMHIEKDDFSELSIASFPQIQDIEDKVLNIDYVLEGTHTLLWSHTCTENTPALLDQQTGQIVEPGSNYTFAASFSDMEDRFVFATDLLSIQDKLNELDVWEFNNTVFVKSNSNESQISVINMQGVEVYSNTGNTFNLNHLSPAMYVVKVKSGEQSSIQKIVIK